MLFVAICAVSSGIGLNRGTIEQVKSVNQSDMTFYSNSEVNIESTIGIDVLKTNSKDYSCYTNYISTGVKYSNFLSSKACKDNNGFYPIFQDENINIIRLSDYNSVLKMLGKDTLNLNENNYAVFSDESKLLDEIKESLDNKKEITINGKKLTPCKEKVIKLSANDSLVKNNIINIVVNDDLVKGLQPISSYVNVNYKESIEKGSREIVEKLKQYNKDHEKDFKNIMYIDKNTSETAIFQNLQL